MTNEYKHIDLAYLVKNSQEQKSIQIKMLNTFLKSLPEYINEAKAAYDDKNWYDLGHVAFKAKDTVPIIGLTEMARYLNKLDFLCRKAENFEAIDMWVEKFILEASEALAEVEAALAKLDPK